MLTENKDNVNREEGQPMLTEKGEKMSTENKDN